jgi:Fur family transcriptional regulator, peroxide stress response regulator
VIIYRKKVSEGILSDPQERLEQMTRVLKDEGCRLTPQRLTMLHILAKSEGHPSAEQIYEQIRAGYPTTSLATVYKTLSLLKNLGEVLELPFAGMGSHYDGNKPYPHPHVICTKCGQILDPEFGPVTGISLEIERQTGYQITHQQLNFFGLCPTCQKEGNRQNKEDMEKSKKP